MILYKRPGPERGIRWYSCSQVALLSREDKIGKNCNPAQKTNRKGPGTCQVVQEKTLIFK